MGLNEREILMEEVAKFYLAERKLSAIAPSFSEQQM